MTEFLVDIRVTPRPGLLDPEGNAVHHALNALGFDGIDDVRIGKSISLHVRAKDEASARETADAVSRRLLANPVTEDFEVESVRVANPA